MKKNGFVQIIVIILVVLAIIVGVYYFGTKNKVVITPVASTQPSATPIVISTPDPATANWKTFSDLKFSIKYPSDWNLNESVFMDKNNNKVAEFLPGYLTLKNKDTCKSFVSLTENGGEIQAVETSYSSQGSIVREKNTIVINNTTWDYIVTKVVYEGGSPNWTGTWYPYDFCTQKDNEMFVLTFYSNKYPSDDMKLYSQILSTFQFTK
jgi:hypothetical protein